MQPNIHKPGFVHGSHPHSDWGSSNAHSPLQLNDGRNVVYLVERDEDTRRQICGGLSGASVEAIGFASITEYMQQNRVNSPACLILDLQTSEEQVPGVSYRLAEEACPPVIFTCGPDDIRLAVRAITGVPQNCKGSRVAIKGRRRYDCTLLFELAASYTSWLYIDAPCFHRKSEAERLRSNAPQADRCKNHSRSPPEVRVDLAQTEIELRVLRGVHLAIAGAGQHYGRCAQEKARTERIPGSRREG